MVNGFAGALLVNRSFVGDLDGLFQGSEIPSPFAPFSFVDKFSTFRPPYAESLPLCLWEAVLKSRTFASLGRENPNWRTSASVENRCSYLYAFLL